MVKKIEISLDEVKRLFEFLENVHDWMHNLCTIKIRNLLKSLLELLKN